MRFPVKSLAAAMLFWVGAVHAEGGYFGGVAGVMSTDIEGDSPFNGGFRIGYCGASGWGIEGEFTGSIVEGELDTYWYGEQDYSISTAALYGTYRSHGDLYFKGRLGYLNEKVDFDGFGSASDSGASAGLGFGFKVSENATMEAEYTLVEEDVNFWSGSVVFRF